MKNYYFFMLLFVGLFHQSFVQAQFCPPTGFTNGNALFFFYDPGTSNCVDRPTSVSVGTSVFTLADCGDIFSVYNLSSGAPLTMLSPFTADLGFGTCEYTDGNLSNQTLSVNQMNAILKSIKLFPNPITSGNTIQVSLGVAVSAKAKIYSVTGKLVKSSTLDNFKTGTIDMSGLSNGVYILQLETDHTSVSKKIIINK